MEIFSIFENLIHEYCIYVISIPPLPFQLLLCPQINLLIITTAYVHSIYNTD